MNYVFLVFFLFSSIIVFSQDTIPVSGMGSRNFDHLDTWIADQCESPHGYSTIKLRKKKIKKELWITSVVNELINRKITLSQADSILLTKGVKPYSSPYNKSGFAATHMIINSDYLTFSIISAKQETIGKQYVGAIVKSTYPMYCKANPTQVIYEVSIDVNFFKKEVMKKITCPYQVFHRLELGDAYFMGLDLNFRF